MKNFQFDMKLLKLLNKDQSQKYTLDEIKNTLDNIELKTVDIKGLFKNFKRCKCANGQCVVNNINFFQYIKNNLVIIDDNIPDCNFYFESKPEPNKVSSIVFI